MLISNGRRFIFIHVPKTAGSSLHNVLSPFSRQDNRTLFRSALRRLPIIESPEHAHFRVHETASKVRSKLSPRVWDTYFSFAVVRNPFDHAVSHYEYLKQYRNKKIANAISNISFVDYLAFRASPRTKLDRVFLKLPAQTNFVCHENKIIVNKIYRFENLKSMISDLSERLMIDAINLPKSNVTRSRKSDILVQYYSTKSAIDLVKQIYHEDFTMFNYSNYPEL